MKDLRRLLGFVRPYRAQAAFSLAMLLAMVALDLSVPRLVEHLIDNGIRPRDLGVVLVTSGVMLAASLLSMVVTVLNSNSSIRVGESVARDLREAIFAKIQGFSHANMDRFTTGRLMVRLTSDASAMQRLVQVSLRIGTRAPLTMIGCVVLMFVTCPPLAFAVLPILLVAGALIVFFSFRMEPLFRGVQAKLDSLNTVLQENIAGARLVKAFVRAGREAERFEAANADLTGDTVKVMEFMSSMSPALTFLIDIGIALALWLGGVRAISGQATVGQIVAMGNYLMAIMSPLIMMTQLANTWANGLASAKRVEEVLGLESELVERRAPRRLEDRGPLPVSFSGVGFRYEGSRGLEALAGIDFRAEAGSTVAILGATGSGKSTLVSLIPRFYDVSSGSVLVGDIDVRDLARDSLLERIAIVPQETILFTGTVRDNIRYGRPEARDEEVVAAAQAAQAHEFILGLPLGYDTMVEERGVNLSGGQKQRLSIARAIVCRPSILILDDSTSAVDVETEARIHDALDRELGECTRFLVAQRISTVLGADKILVLDAGRLVAEGRHAELLRSSPVYREIFDSQLGGGIHE